MAIANAEIARLFERLADLLEIEGENPFRVRAYRNVAHTVEDLSRSIPQLIEQGYDLTDLPGVGKELALKLRQVAETGRLPLLEEVEARTPGALCDLMRIGGLGPKRVGILYHQLGIRSVEDLRRALRGGAIRELPGFGTRTEQIVAAGIEHLYGSPQRVPLHQAEQIAAPLVEYLRKFAGVRRVEVAGSLRRRKETVGDLDLLVACSRGAAVGVHFVAYPEVTEVLAQGGTRCTVRLRSGLQVDLRVVPTVSFGAALHYFTGSKAHNVAVRTRGARRRRKINEYGVFDGEERVGGRTEEEVFAAAGLPYIEPELREDHGEIEAAIGGTLPRLVQTEDLRGDLHVHTDASDGRASLHDMVRAAAARGYAYLAICDHSRRATVAHGLDASRLLRQIDDIDALNATLENFVVLKGVEVDILEDGTLDLPDEVLAQLDLRVCSVHYRFDLDRERQTERILRAMDNPWFNILAHPTGRLINQREPYALDLERVMRAAKDHGCILEVNAQTQRLDLNDSHCRMARSLGVKLALSSDAHDVGQLATVRYGIDQARRGWLQADDIVNTREPDGLRVLLRRK